MKSWKSRSGNQVGKLASTLAGTALLALLAGTSAQARSAPMAPSARISVEVAASTASGAAADIRRQLPARIAAELAAQPGKVLPSGKRIVVRITTIFLSSDFNGGAARRDSGSAMQDGIDGEMLVVDGFGHVSTRKAISSRSPVHAGGSWHNPNHERKRVAALVDNLAYWVVRGLE